MPFSYPQSSTPLSKTIETSRCTHPPRLPFFFLQNQMLNLPPAFLQLPVYQVMPANMVLSARYGQISNAQPRSLERLLQLPQLFLIPRFLLHLSRSSEHFADVIHSLMLSQTSCWIPPGLKFGDGFGVSRRTYGRRKALIFNYLRSVLISFYSHILICCSLFAS